MPTQISMNIADVQAKLGMLGNGLQRGLVTAVAEWLRYDIRQAFERESSPEGVPWKPLSAQYAARKAGVRGGRRKVFARKVGPGGKPGAAVMLGGLRILELTGALFNSIDRGMVISGNTVSATSSLPYSAIHQYGGLAGRGLRSRIPARPYLPSPAFAEQEAAKVCDEKIAQLLGEAGLQ